MPRPRYPLTYPRLKSRIAELDRSQTALAAEIGCVPETITQVLRGRLRPSDGLKARLADALHSTVAELFDEAA